MINIGTAFRYRLKFYKSAGVSCHGFNKVLGHAVSEGGFNYVEKNNHPKVYVYLGAADDEESETEIAEIFLKVYAEPKDVETKLAPVFKSSGFVLKEVKLLPYGISNVQNLISHVCYKVSGVRGNINRGLSLCPSAEREHLYSIERLDDDEIKIIMRINPSGSFSPVPELLKLLGLDVREGDYKATRMALYWVDKQGVLRPV